MFSKCPHCDKPISKILVEEVPLAGANGRQQAVGVVYSCFACKVAISVTPQVIINKR